MAKIPVLTVYMDGEEGPTMTVDEFYLGREIDDLAFMRPGEIRTVVIAAGELTQEELDAREPFPGYDPEQKGRFKR